MENPSTPPERNLAPHTHRPPHTHREKSPQPPNHPDRIASGFPRSYEPFAQHSASHGTGSGGTAQTHANPASHPQASPQPYDESLGASSPQAPGLTPPDHGYATSPPPFQGAMPDQNQGSALNRQGIPYYPSPQNAGRGNPTPSPTPYSSADYQPAYRQPDNTAPKVQGQGQATSQRRSASTRNLTNHPAPVRNAPLDAQDRLLQERRLSAAGKPVVRSPAHRYVDDDEFVPYFRAQEPYRPQHTDYRFWVLGGVLLVGLTVLIEPTRVISSIVKTQEYDCQEVVQPQSVLSRERLTKLLSIPERASKEQVRQVIQEPYCLMPSIKIRAGVSAVREAYPLESDPDTWVVMLYEGDEYAGYRFNVR